MSKTKIKDYLKKKLEVDDYCIYIEDNKLFKKAQVLSIENDIIEIIRVNETGTQLKKSKHNLRYRTSNELIKISLKIK